MLLGEIGSVTKQSKIMLERRTMIGGGVIGPHDTEFMGYPIVDSVEGPLEEIGSANCTEGCITRCLLTTFNYMALVVYVLRTNGNIYLIDSSYIICDKIIGGSTDQISSYLCIPCKSETSRIYANLRKFPNTIA